MHKSLEPDLGRMIAYCGHLGRQSTDQMLRRAGYDVTPVQTQALMYLPPEKPGDQPAGSGAGTSPEGLHGQRHCGPPGGERVYLPPDQPL